MDALKAGYIAFGADYFILNILNFVVLQYCGSNWNVSTLKVLVGILAAGELQIVRKYSTKNI